MLDTKALQLGFGFYADRRYRAVAVDATFTQEPCLFGEHVRVGVECQPRVQLRGYTGIQPCRVERSRAKPE
jgi:hypothetical protein